jgi:hypothetical protein
MVKLFDADNCSAPWELVAAHERPFLALPDDQLTFLTLVTLNAGGLCGRLRGQDVALLVQFESRFTFGIVTAPEERPEPAVLMYHRLAAFGTFMFA